MSLWTIPWLCKYSRPSKSWQKYLRQEKKKKGAWTCFKQTISSALVYMWCGERRFTKTQMPPNVLTNITLKVYSEERVRLTIWNKNRSLTRELEILETVSQEHCPTFPACHKRSTPLPYTYQNSQGREKTQNKRMEKHVSSHQTHTNTSWHVGICFSLSVVFLR